MTVSYLKYKLVDGFVHNWLTVGPELNALDEFDGNPLEPDRKLTLLQEKKQTDYEITQVPVEPGPVGDGIFNTETFQGTWAYTKCKEDHLVLIPVFAAKASYFKSWAYVELKAKSARKVILDIFTYNTINIWINNQFIDRKVVLSSHTITRFPVEVALVRGNNPLLIRCEDIADGDRALAFAVKVSDEDGFPASDIQTIIPTTIPNPSRRERLEKAFYETYVERDIFSSDSHVELKWPNKIRYPVLYQIRLQTPAGRIYAESFDRGKDDQTAFLSYAASLPEGPYEILLMPSASEYYETNMRITRKIPVWISGNHSFSELPYGTYESRRREALIDAARREGDLFAEIANMELDKWASIDLPAIQKNIQKIKDNPQFNLIDLLGLTGAVERYGKSENEVTKILVKALGEINPEFSGFNSFEKSFEGQQLISFTIQLLMSQKTSDIQKQRLLEQQISDWLISRGQRGFETGNSPQVVADVILALSYLIDLAESEQVVDLAGALMDKLLLLLAIHTYKGVFGGGFGYATEMDILNGVTQPTSGICRLFWGMGAYNQHLANYVSLACLQNYEMPSIISDIAASDEELWGTENHRSMLKATYRTSDYMLSSVMELESGQSGQREHVWQATLGSEAIVFTNHPAANSNISLYVPDFWCGNSCSPKAVQWKDVLLAIYNLPPDDFMGYTHAHFPTHAFDEYKSNQNWFFARKGEAYLAITASNPVHLVKTGDSAYRELRCPGNQSVWVCQLGRKSQDGSFYEFQKRVLDLPLEISGLEIKLTTLRSEQLAFGWDSTFLLNHNDVKYQVAHHIHYPFASGAYPMKSLEVYFNEYLLKLNFDPEV